MTSQFAHPSHSHYTQGDASGHRKKNGGSTAERKHSNEIKEKKIIKQELGREPDVIET
jgi:hypothetical protein